MALLIAEGIPVFRLQTPGVPPRFQAVFRGGSATATHPAVIRDALSRPHIAVHLAEGEEYLLIGSSPCGSITLPNGQLVDPKDIAGLSIPTAAQRTAPEAAAQPYQGPSPYQGSVSRPMCVDCGADFANAGLLGLHKKRDHGDAGLDAEASSTASDLVPA